MDENSKKILVDVQIVQNYVEAKKDFDAAKKSLDEFIKSGSKNVQQQQQLVTSYSNAKSAFKDASKELDNYTRQNNVIANLQVQVAEKTNNVNRSLGDMKRELAQLRNVPLDGLNPNQIGQVELAMAKLKNEITDYNAKLNGLNTEKFFANLASTGQAFAALTQTVGQFTNILGIESTAFKSIQDNMVQLIAVTQALGVVTEYLNQKKYILIATNIKSIAITIQEAIVNAAAALSKKINAAATEAQTAAENGNIIAKTKSIILTHLATAAQWLWNAAMAANPIGLLIAGIILLVAAVAALIAIFSKSNDAQKEATKAQAEYEAQAAKTKQTLEEYNRSFEDSTNRRKTAARAELLQMKANGASKEQIAKRERELQNQQSQAVIDNFNKTLPTRKAELIALQNNINAQVALLNTMDVGSKKYNEQIAKVNELKSARLGLIGSINKEADTAKNAALDIVDNNQAQKEADKQAAKDRAQKYKEQQDKALENANKLIELQKNFNEQALKAEAKFQSDDFATKAAYEKKIFDLNQKAEQDKLDLQLKYKKITQTEYNKQNIILNDKQTEFQNQQIKNLQNYINDQIKTIQSMIDKDVDAQIADVNKKYADARKNIENMPAPKQIAGESNEDFAKRTADYEAFMLNKAIIETQLEKQQAKDIAEIRANSLKQQISDIEKTYSQMYEEDFAKFTDNERQKNLAEMEMLYKQIAEKKKKGLSTYSDEATLRTAQAKENQFVLNSELAMANLTAKQKYDAKKAWLDKELEIYKGNKTKEQEIATQQAENEKELYDARLEAFNYWSSKVSEMFGAMNELANANAEAELQKYTEDNDTKKASLQERLDAGLISQENYDKQVAALDKDLDKKKADLARKQAIRDKAMKLFGVITATIQSIAESAKMGFPAAIPFIAMAAALGTIQTAAIIAQPLPKASKGILLRGASHAQGGIPIEAEGGEAIINKKSTKMFAPLLSAINQAGGGVPFATQNQIIAGQMLRKYSSTTTDNVIADRIVEGIKNQKIYVAMDEFNRANTNYLKLTDNQIL